VLRLPALSPDHARLAHLLLEWAAIALGVQIYRWQRRRAGQGGMLEAGSFTVIIACILGAAIGNKVVFWIECPQLFGVQGGQSIVGGLLGGLLGVELGKKLAGIRHSTGDLFILPLMVGTVVGRLGCLLAGLQDGTYGVASGLRWAVDFGDGVARHPTQAYEIGFVLLWGGGILHLLPRLAHKPGLGFKLYLAGYLVWRLLVDGIKPVPYDYGAGLSGIQLVCLLALACYLPLLGRQLRQRTI